MKKLIGVILILAVALLVSGFGGLAPKTQGNRGSAKPGRTGYPMLIDNFEDGTYTENPEWFVFDNVVPEVSKNSRLQDGDSQVVRGIGEYSLKLAGSTSSWYVGGLGTMLGSDASNYNSLELDIYGNGANSGKLKLELYDDDNGNNEIEVDPSWKPLYDDLFVVEVPIDWTGWKHVSLPISEFKIEGRGNKAFDPALSGGSSGLTKIQLICLSNAEGGSFKCNVDNIELGVR